MKVMIRFALVGELLFVVLSNLGLASIGLDLSGNTVGYTAVTNDNWTLGYAFSVPAGTVVSGLGFWDRGNGFNTTTVGLWDTSGTLLGSVSSATSSVTTTPTAIGLGTWNFMSFNLAIPAGSYVVGSWGVGMDYLFSFTEPRITSGLTFIQNRYQGGGTFQFPTVSDGINPSGYYGGNVRLNDTTGAVPEPLSLAVWGGLATIGGFVVCRRGQKGGTKRG